MADSKTPENDKRTVSNAEKQPVPFMEGPTPKNEKKALGGQRHVFMSPTDAMTSPCTQQLMNHHRLPRRQTRPVPKSGLLGNTTLPVSKLANKENEDKQIKEKEVEDKQESPATEQSDSTLLKSS